MPERRDLYFTTTYPDHSETRLAENVTEKEANKIMRDFMKGHGWTCYYIRVWEPVKGVHRRYDIGSHTEFFDWVKGDKNE